MFTCKKLRYVWNSTTKEFQKIKSLGPGLPTSSFHHADAQQGFAGLSILEQERRYFGLNRYTGSLSQIILNSFRRAIFGPNFINVPVKSVVELLVLEVLNPFYIFQVVAIFIWIMIEYYYFAGAIVIMSVAGIVISIVQTRQVNRIEFN